MDLGNLGQTFTANKGPILATAAAGVAGFALYQRHKAGAGAPAGQGVTTDTSYSAGDQTAGMLGANSYDSSASDVYGLVQPQLESLGSQLTDLQNKLDAVPVSTQPVSKPTPVTAKPTPAPAHAAPRPAPVPVPAAKHAVDTWVTVNRGDSLSAIAARYPQQDITWQSIYNANRSTVGGNPNLIRPGQRLHVVG